ncbi:nitroreductase family protein [Alteromonas sp. C1M14]|uniref:nitroreductase family protein n=1 Tax=Alteromonas sp. C1M14 TaxID=2841567 RepID=UPI001C081EE8|nr:nitroreductase family protein [Alteromonas sp. C1M14]MBU2979257.1 nitroreductase family protein [Alteromonas sp. C1M14]
MTHPIIDELNQRHTVKHYDATRKVSKQNLEVLCEALRLSPSSINSQPWKFIVIESEDAKQRFHDTFENKFQFNQKHAKTASHTILFAYNPRYTREDYAKVVDQQIADGRMKKEDREQGFGAYAFVDLNTAENGVNAAWTKAQTYLALGNAMHTLARLGIDSTPMEGVDKDLIARYFGKELDGYVCEVALAIGYHDEQQDYNAQLPKSRLPKDDIITVV